MLIELIKENLLKNWDKFFQGIDRPKVLRFLLVKGSIGGSGGRVTFMFFKDSDIVPFAVAKINRDPVSSSIILNEHDALSYLYQNLDPDLRRRIPRPLGAEEINGYNVLFQEGCKGESLDRIITKGLFLNKKAAFGLLRNVAGWIAELKYFLQKKESAISEQTDQDRYVDMVDSFMRIFDLSKDEMLFLDNLKNKLQNEETFGHSAFFCHNDFSLINILFDRNGFKVIDWAQAKKTGPLLDDFFFLLNSFIPRYYSNSLEGKIKTVHFREMFMKKGRLSDIAIAIIKSIFEKFDMPSEFIRISFSLFLVKSAVLEYEQLKKQADRGFVVSVRPFDKSAHYQDETLFKTGLYINLFRELVLNKKDLIF